MEKHESVKVTAASLTFDVLMSTFKFLDTKNRGKAAQVSTSWKEAANSKSLWQNSRITIRSGKLNRQSENSIIERGVKRFDVHVLELRIIEFLRRVPDMEDLRFIGCYVRQNLREFFDLAPNSSEILSLAAKDDVQMPIEMDFYGPLHVHYAFFHREHIPSCLPNNNRVLEMFTIGMRQLKELSLDGCGCSKFEIDFFAGEDVEKEDRLTSLQKLRISHVRYVDEPTIHYISQKFVNLVSLNFDVCTIVSSEGFGHLLKLKKLQHLSIVNAYGITNALLESISILSNLKSLDLGGCHLNVTDNGLQSISRLTNLEHLSLKYLVVTDAAFKFLNKLPHLRELGLQGSMISDEGLLFLTEGNLKLTKLDISFCENVGDRGLLHMCQSTFVLHNLDVSGCNITDYGISHLIKSFPCLQIPDLSSCSFLDDELSQFIIEKLNQNKKLNFGNIGNDQDFMISSTGRLDSRLQSFLNSHGF